MSNSKLSVGWRMVTFGDIARQVKVDADPETSGLERYIAGEHMETDDLHIRRWGTIGDGYLGPAFHRKFVAGQILYGSRRTYLRKVAVADFDGICANTTFVIEPKVDLIIPELLPFIMQSEGFNEHSVQNSKGSVNPYINWKDIASYEFALPPKDEQRRIAEILWAAEEANESYLVVAISARKLQRSLWIDRVKKRDWPKVPLSHVVAISTGSTPSRKVTRYWQDGTVPWLTTTRVNDRVITKADEYVTTVAFEECSLNPCPKGSTLIALYGEGKTRGVAAYLAFEACINQAFACLQPTEQIDEWYLYYYFENSYRELRSFSQGSNQKNLSGQILETFPIRVPPKIEQKQIVELVRRMDEQILSVKSHCLRLQGLKKTLLSELL